MKKFIYKVLIFLFIPIIAYSLCFYVVKAYYIHNIKNHSNVLLGDSQTEFIKNKSLYNNSVQGSPYLVHYEFAKKFKDELRGKKVYIAFNYHSLSAMYQNRIKNADLFPGWRNQVYKEINAFNILNKKHEISSINEEHSSLFNIKKPYELLKNEYHRIKNTNTFKSVENDTLSINKTIERHWYDKNLVLKDEIQKTYLSKLVKYLKRLNCEVILLKMPLTEYYSHNIPLKEKENFYKLTNELNCRLIDLNDTLKISNKYELFKDYGHLNIRGDSIVNSYLEKNEF